MSQAHDEVKLIQNLYFQCKAFFLIQKRDYFGHWLFKNNRVFFLLNFHKIFFHSHTNSIHVRF